MHKEHQLKALISLHSTHLVIIKVCFNDFFLEYGLQDFKLNRPFLTLL